VNLFVLDASVAAKWLLPRGHETLVDEAFSLLDRYGKKEALFIVPDFFWVCVK
jgi:predicted nucleic acid-binding protein